MLLQSSEAAVVDSEGLQEADEVERLLPDNRRMAKLQLRKSQMSLPAQTERSQLRLSQKRQEKV